MEKARNCKAASASICYRTRALLQPLSLENMAFASVRTTLTRVFLLAMLAFVRLPTVSGDFAQAAAFGLSAGPAKRPPKKIVNAGLGSFKAPAPVDDCDPEELTCIQAQAVKSPTFVQKSFQGAGKVVLPLEEDMDI